MKAELNKLNTELVENPLFKKIRQIEALLTLYEKTEQGRLIAPTIAPTLAPATAPIVAPNVEMKPDISPIETQQPVGVEPTITKLPLAPGSVRTNSKVAKVRRAIFDYLTLNGPSKRSAILDHLKQKGLMGTEKEPIRVLASYLTTSKDLFENRGAGVWKLAKGAKLDDPDQNPVKA